VTETEIKEILGKYNAATRAGDGAMLSSIMTENVVWSIPGTSVVSGEARGVDAILKRSKIFAEHEVNMELLHVLYGYRDVALSLHNTGKHEGRSLDEHLTTVLLFQDGKISQINTYMSDVSMLGVYFK
jgi:ketosteroid isomerase-like protein